MSRQDLHFRLRIPEELKARVEKAAAEKNRSMTAEIVARLEQSFRAEEIQAMRRQLVRHQRDVKDEVIEAAQKILDLLTPPEI